MRWGSGTNFGLAWSVVTFTNETIACLAAPSFHDGSGSVCAKAGTANERATPNARIQPNVEREIMDFTPASSLAVNGGRPLLPPSPARPQHTSPLRCSLGGVVALTRAPMH